MYHSIRLRYVNILHGYHTYDHRPINYYKLGLCILLLTTLIYSTYQFSENGRSRIPVSGFDYIFSTVKCECNNLS